MAGNTIQIEGLDKALKKIKSIEDLSAVSDALKAAAVHVKGKIAQYPPSSEANSPKQKRWYERGYGTRWMRADGSLGGRKTSETLGRKWTIASKNRGLTWIVGNNVSYGPYVQDSDKQAAFHKRRGWKTTQKVASEEAATVSKFVAHEIDRILAK